MIWRCCFGCILLKIVARWWIYNFIVPLCDIIIICKCIGQTQISMIAKIPSISKTPSALLSKIEYKIKQCVKNILRIQITWHLLKNVVHNDLENPTLWTRRLHKSHASLNEVGFRSNCIFDVASCFLASGHVTNLFF